jgi:hypothetical protein
MEDRVNAGIEEEDFTRQRAITAEIAIEEILQTKHNGDLPKLREEGAKRSTVREDKHQSGEGKGNPQEDKVEEYSVPTATPARKESEKREAILSSFFTSSERHLLSQAKGARSKLLFIGAMMGGIGLVGALVVGYLLLKVLKLFGN